MQRAKNEMAALVAAHDGSGATTASASALSAAQQTHDYRFQLRPRDYNQLQSRAPIRAASGHVARRVRLQGDPPPDATLHRLCVLYIFHTHYSFRFLYQFFLLCAFFFDCYLYISHFQAICVLAVWRVIVAWFWMQVIGLLKQRTCNTCAQLAKYVFLYSTSIQTYLYIISFFIEEIQSTRSIIEKNLILLTLYLNHFWLASSD